MFGKNTAKQAQQQANQQQQLANQYLQQANTKSPLQLAREKESTDWINQTTSPDFDVTKVSGMSPWLSLYRAATQNRADEQTMSSGLLRLGTNYSNPDQAAKLNRLQDDRRQEAAAGGLEQAFGLKDASERGDVMPLLGLQQSNNLALAGLSNSSAENAWTRYYNAQQNSGFLNSNLFNQLMGGARAYMGNSSAFHGFKDGGDWTRYLKRPVWVGEEGPELAVADDGDTQLLGARAAARRA